MNMDKTMTQTIRAWGINEGVLASVRGPVPQWLIDAYWQAHPDQAAAIEAAQVDEPEPEESEPVGPRFTITVESPDQEWGDTIAGHLVNAISAIHAQILDLVLEQLRELPTDLSVTDAILKVEEMHG